jgi:hypothetical protein
MWYTGWSSFSAIRSPGLAPGGLCRNCVFVCVRACVHVCVCVCVSTACVCVCVFWGGVHGFVLASAGRCIGRRRAQMPGWRRPTWSESRNQRYSQKCDPFFSPAFFACSRLHLSPACTRACACVASGAGLSVVCRGTAMHAGRRPSAPALSRAHTPQCTGCGWRRSPSTGGARQRPAPWPF